MMFPTTGRTVTRAGPHFVGESAPMGTRHQRTHILCPCSQERTSGTVCTHDGLFHSIGGREFVGRGPV